MQRPMQRPMRRLMVVIMLAALAWGAAWLGGRALIGQGAARLIAAAPLQPAPKVQVGGFPGHFTARAAPFGWADPLRGITFAGAGGVAQVALWRPWRVSLTLDPGQALALPGLDLTAGAVKAALHLTPRLSLPLDEAGIAVQDLRLSGPLPALADGVALRLRATGGRDYALWLHVDGITLDAGAGEAAARATVCLSAPLDRHMTSPPHVMALQLRQSELALGDVVIVAEGQLSADAGGIAQGRIDLHIRGWRALPDLLVALGMVEARLKPTLLALFTGYAGDQAAGVLTIPLRLEDGRMTLGPLPLGPAPRLP